MKGCLGLKSKIDDFVIFTQKSTGSAKSSTGFAETLSDKGQSKFLMNGVYKIVLTFTNNNYISCILMVLSIYASMTCGIDRILCSNQTAISLW